MAYRKCSDNEAGEDPTVVSHVVVTHSAETAPVTELGRFTSCSPQKSRNYKNVFSTFLFNVIY